MTNTAIEGFPAPVYAAISGTCMGGGLDLALACHHRIASPHAVFGHRGAALGLITGWEGTQRLPRLIGKGRALHLLVAAEKVTASQALRLGLVDAIAADPVGEALHRIAQGPAGSLFRSESTLAALRRSARLVYRSQSASSFLDPWLNGTNLLPRTRLRRKMFFRRRSILLPRATKRTCAFWPT